MKKAFTIGCLALTLMLTITGCGNKKAKNLDMTPSEVITKVYEGISDMPKVANVEINKDNASYYLGTDKIDFKEAVASEPLMGSNAYSVVVVKLNDGVDVENAKKLIKDNVNPAKWICVDAEIVKVDNIGDTIILIMMDELNEELATEIENNFNKLK